MNRNKVVILIVILLAILTGVYFTWFNNIKKGNKSYNWFKTYEDGLVEPYDFGLFKKLLIHESPQGFTEVRSDLTKKLSTLKQSDSNTYFFIGQYCIYTKRELDSLLGFVSRGGQAVLIVEQIPDTLYKVLQEFGKPFKIKPLVSEKVMVNFKNSSSPIQNYKFNYRFFEGNLKQVTDWSYIDESEQLEYYYGNMYSRYLRLGTINKALNYAKFRVGNGYIYLHTNPILFTNYFMANDTGFMHAQHVFAELHTGTILYDIAARYDKEDSESFARQSDSPLTYILKQKSLKLAWYFLLAAVILFFLFKAKREQRIIPVLEQKRNTSLNFIETISGLYFKFNDHKKMARIKMNLFNAFLRTKLAINTKSFDEETILHISNKAKVPLQDTRNIFEFNEKFIQSNSALEAAELIQFNTYIETFYHYYNAKK
ncbi:MAG: hypothetical protein PSX81_14070 [bacterium]|nr:hypothetical protein [bacterium]